MIYVVKRIIWDFKKCLLQPSSVYLSYKDDRNMYSNFLFFVFTFVKLFLLRWNKVDCIYLCFDAHFVRCALCKNFYNKKLLKAFYNPLLCFEVTFRSLTFAKKFHSAKEFFSIDFLLFDMLPRLVWVSVFHFLEGFSILMHQLVFFGDMFRSTYWRSALLFYRCFVVDMNNWF